MFNKKLSVVDMIDQLKDMFSMAITIVIRAGIHDDDLNQINLKLNINTIAKIFSLFSKDESVENIQKYISDRFDAIYHADGNDNEDAWGIKSQHNKSKKRYLNRLKRTYKKVCTKTTGSKCKKIKTQIKHSKRQQKLHYKHKYSRKIQKCRPKYNQKSKKNHY